MMAGIPLAVAIVEDQVRTNDETVCAGWWRSRERFVYNCREDFPALESGIREQPWIYHLRARHKGRVGTGRFHHIWAFKAD